jgi:NADH-quinone oxidoreductase subunit M
MGTYVLMRFAFRLFPAAAGGVRPWIALLAVIGIIYGALVAMVQPDMKKLVAYFLGEPPRFRGARQSAR